MPCKAGYPTEKCPFGYDGRVTRAACGGCKHYAPPPHILAWCMLWDREQVLCKLPKSACAGCPDKHERAPGRPLGEGMDWRDPKAVRAYFERYRELHPNAGGDAMTRFLAKDPSYFARYRAINRERIAEINRRYYQNKKRRLEQGT